MDPAEFRQTVSRLRNFIQRDAKSIIRIEAVRLFKQSFRDEGFTDEVLIKWPDITERRKEQKRKRNRSAGAGDLPPILTDTGDLGNSITGRQEGRDVIVSSDLPYAQRHNEGLKGMPKRQFMGPSKQLDRTIAAKLDKGFGRILNRI